MKFLNKNKGITLIALVVTIVVLLILAGVSIATLTGENGILTRTNVAKEKAEEASIAEEVELLLTEWNIKKHAYGNAIDIEKFLKEKVNVAQVTTSFGLQKFKYKGYKITVNENKKNIVKMEKTTEDKFVTANGQLRVEGAYLKNQYGHDIQLKGVCIWAYGDTTYNADFFRNLKEKYEVNCVRLSLNSLNPDTEQLDEKGRAFGYLYNIIDAIIENDMYAILDWHLINSGGFTNNPYDYEESATKVFTAFAQAYKNVPNLMFELANEPSGTWEELMPYYNELIPKIRAISPNCVILTTSAGHGLDLASIIANPLQFDNIMYTMHFYYNDYYLTEIRQIGDAVLQGLPIFVTEWSTTNGGGGASQLTYANTLTNFMDNYNISSTYWMLTNGNTEYENFIDATKYAVNYINHNYVDDSYSKYNYTISDYTMMPRPSVIENPSVYTNDSLWHLELYRDNIINIIFKDEINIPDNIVTIRDISQTAQGNLIAYLVNNEEQEGMYDLYIEGNEIYFPSVARGMFQFMKNVNYFYNLNIVNTSNVQYFDNIFKGMTSLKEIDLSNFNTSNVTNFNSMFNSCSSLEKINVSNFDTTNAQYMIQMFVCSNLKSIDLSNFNTEKLTGIYNIFQSTHNLVDIDISSFDFRTIDNYDNMFVFAENVNRTIYVKDEYAKEIVQTLSPKATIIVKE